MTRAPIGIFRQVSRPTYDDQTRDQVARETERGVGDLQDLIDGNDHWTVA
jgi:2-oxoglutarate ferredoxin oxidoreductase subunit beta